MCGITGFVDPRNAANIDSMDATVLAMAERIQHRGPDDAGAWCDPQTGIALGQRRLSIIDLSPAGHQPMISACERFVIAYNGEVYNFTELRAELEHSGRRFRGHSDTEVILEAIAAWGMEATLSRLIGMFAFALWDRKTNKLTLVRDRLGIKPLFWGLHGGTLFFGSELKALLAFPGWRPELNRDAVSAFLRHSYIPAPHSVYKDVHKLQPGSYLEFTSGAEPVVRSFWDFRQIAADAIKTRGDVDSAEAVEQLDELLRDAIGRRMIADVPLGALLSGGIDSSLVTAIMQAQSDRPVRSFSIGFAEDKFNEAPYAKAIAKHLGTEHTELYVDPSHAVEVVPNLPDWFDEPFADSSQIPTYLVCELTRQHVTVVLSGDGGDELFAGYNRYAQAQAAWQRSRRVPAPLRQLLGRGLRNVSETNLDRLAQLIPQSRRPHMFGNKVHKVAQRLLYTDPDTLYRQLMSLWWDPDSVVIGGNEVKEHFWNPEYQDMIPDFTDRMQFLDTLTYLPDDILTKVDRTSMAVSLEARVPLLDHRVVEFAWRMPQHLKVQNGDAKLLLKSVLQKYVPRHLTERPKMGFGIPLHQWLRGTLRDWAEDLLATERLTEQGLLRPEPIRAMWQSHLAGDDHSYALWNVLMLQAWMDRYPT